MMPEGSTATELTLKSPNKGLGGSQLSPPLTEIEASYMVPAGSSIKSNEEVDRVVDVARDDLDGAARG